MRSRIRRFRAPHVVMAALLAAGAWVSIGAGSTTAGRASAKTLHYEYVVNDGVIYVYDIDRAQRLVKKLVVPQIVGSHGVVASPVTGILYVSYRAQGGSYGPGTLLAWDLVRNRVLWTRAFPDGIDSMAITPNGKTIYMPDGEGAASNHWRVVDASNGDILATITAGAKPHNTIMGLDGKYVYLGGCGYPYLVVVSTATNTVVREIGPLNNPGVRPFTINGSQTLAFTTAYSFLGFQVSSITTGKVLYSVAPAGFTWDQQKFGVGSTPDHGISLSPNEKELYLIDTPNGYVHVFDVSGLPAKAPRDTADIKMRHPPPSDGWLQHSRSGRYVYVGRAGDVIDTKLRKVVAYLPPLQRTADFLEIDWRNGKPVATTSRYGVGYISKR